MKFETYLTHVQFHEMYNNHILECNSINHKILKMLPLNLCLIKIEFSDKLLPLINAIQGYIPQFKTIEYHLKILD